MNAAPLVASRTALVATASMRFAPSWRASVAMRINDSIASRIGSSESVLVSTSPVPSRGAAFISSTTRIRPLALTSATI